MLKLCGLDEFSSRIKNKKLYFIGAGKNALQLMLKYDWEVACCIDNDVEKKGTFLEAQNKRIPIYGWDFLLSKVTQETVLLVTPSDFEALEKQIDSESILDKVSVYILKLMESIQYDMDRIEASKAPFSITKGTVPKIPKIIHYFWFSGDPYPENVQKCIDSWHKFCPDYEFKKWDLTNYKTDCRFANEALEHKCWAVASDYGRCDVVYRYGGIYLDTDVELIKPLDDLLYDDGFIGFEDLYYVDPGSGFGATQNNPIVKQFCSIYERDNTKFVLDDGSLNKIICPAYYTKKLEDIGLRHDGSFQNLGGFVVYPPLVLCPHSYRTGAIVKLKTTFSIHHHYGGWFDQRQKAQSEKRMLFFEQKRKELHFSYF